MFVCWRYKLKNYLTEENNIQQVVDPITEEAMVTFSVKNIQVGHPKDTINEKKIDGRKNIFFCFECI